MKYLSRPPTENIIYDGKKKKQKNNKESKEKQKKYDKTQKISRFQRKLVTTLESCFGYGVFNFVINLHDQLNQKLLTKTQSPEALTRFLMFFQKMNSKIKIVFGRVSGFTFGM